MTSPSRILVACDKFKGSLTASEACEAIARGIRKRFPGAIVERHPIADGGEGFTASLATALGGAWVGIACQDALGHPIRARYLRAETGNRHIAVMDMSEVSGSWRLAESSRDILNATTFGTGEMIRHAVTESAVERVIIGLGGSATNDGGAGMAAALGVRFLDESGNELPPLPRVLADRLHAIDDRPKIPLPLVTAACDVDNPLLGDHGATRVFGPQKGAEPCHVPVLETALERIVRHSNGYREADQPGAGAAGGLGFGLLRFANAELVPGFDLMASLTGLEAAVSKADLVVTGEGSLDAQSLSGKGPVAIARLARRMGKPVIACCGRTDPTVAGSGLFDSILPLAATGLPAEDLMRNAAELLERIAADG